MEPHFSQTRHADPFTSETHIRSDLGSRVDRSWRNLRTDIFDVNIDARW